MNKKNTTLNLPKGIYFGTKPVEIITGKLDSFILQDKYDYAEHATLSIFSLLQNRT